MARIIAIVEGQTEQTFVRDLLAPELGSRGAYITARLVGHPGHKGGFRNYDRPRREIVNLLKEDSGTYVTTMFDLYALPSDWPGRQEYRDLPYPDRVESLERATHEDITSRLPPDLLHDRFIPYIQSHEFEALLFSDIATLDSVFPGSGIQDDLTGILREFGNPEAIDDDPETAPSRRILKLIPRYRKVFHGALTARRIGIDRMRQMCPRFDSWIHKLEDLGETRPRAVQPVP